MVMMDGPPPGARQQYFAFLIVTTLVACVCIFVWLLSPLGLGFQDGPSNPTTKEIALTIFIVSYFVGLPALAIGQVASPILWLYAHTRGAYIIPLLTIGSFLLCAGTFLFVFSRL